MTTSALKLSEREQIASEFEWLAPGSGIGAPDVVGSIMWAMDDRKPDIKSNVWLTGSLDSYTDDEFALMIAFARRQRDHYDAMYNVRRGCNAILIGKEIDTWENGRTTVRWLAKRMSWQFGSFYACNLASAMNRFEREQLGSSYSSHAGWKVLLAATGDSGHGGAKWVGEEEVVDLVGHYDGEFKAPEYLSLTGVRSDGSKVHFANSRVIVSGPAENFDRLLEMYRANPED